MSGATLPNAGQAVVAADKIAYLFNPLHPANQGKAAFFVRFGFSLQHWPTLQTTLRDHPRANLVVRVTSQPFGLKYRVDCSIQSPDGRNPCITSIWMIDHGATVPRFVTAYPNTRRAPPSWPRSSP